MNNKGWMILQVFINHYHPKAGDAYLKLFHQEEKQAMQALNIHSGDLLPLLQLPGQAIERIHYSWLRPLLDSFPEALRPAVVSSFSPEQQAGFPGFALPSVSRPVKDFFLDKLSAKLQVEEHLPMEYLPNTELSPLLDWSKKQLINLIDFLGIHDLASEVRHILNRDHLNNVYSSLTPKQLHYLKTCLHQKEKIVSPKLGIDPTKRDPDALHQILHRRGLVRFGRAFSGQHPDLIWHIAHRLDSGRGKMLLKEYQPNALPGITPVLKQQVVGLMNFLKSE